MHQKVFFREAMKNIIFQKMKVVGNNWFYGSIQILKFHGANPAQIWWILTELATCARKQTNFPGL